MIGTQKIAVGIFCVPEANFAGHTDEIRRALYELDGVLDVQVNYITDRVCVNYDAAKISSQKIREIIGDFRRV
jgi:cation transport ATPase